MNERKSDTHTDTHTQTHEHMYIYIHIYTDTHHNAGHPPSPRPASTCHDQVEVAETSPTDEGFAAVDHVPIGV